MHITEFQQRLPDYRLYKLPREAAQFRVQINTPRIY